VSNYCSKSTVLITNVLMVGSSLWSRAIRGADEIRNEPGPFILKITNEEREIVSNSRWLNIGERIHGQFEVRPDRHPAGIPGWIVGNPKSGHVL
jgi:hypothetical protein